MVDLHNLKVLFSEKQWRLWAVFERMNRKINLEQGIANSLLFTLGC